MPKHTKQERAKTKKTVAFVKANTTSAERAEIRARSRNSPGSKAAKRIRESKRRGGGLGIARALDREIKAREAQEVAAAAGIVSRAKRNAKKAKAKVSGERKKVKET